MIKIERTSKGNINTEVEGDSIEVVEELVSGISSIVELLIEQDALDEEDLEAFVYYTFVQEVLKNVSIKEV